MKTIFFRLSSDERRREEETRDANIYSLKRDKDRECNLADERKSEKLRVINQEI